MAHTLILMAALQAANIAETHPGADAFIEEMATNHAFAREEVTALLASSSPQNSILEAMRRPAEGMPWHRYRKIFMTEDRINGGVAFMKEHRELLAEVEQKYQVPAEVVTAIIGVETFYGRITGSYRVLDALATLAFHYPPRASFFRGELEHFLLLGRDESLDLTAIKGSYAGAMGLGQFIPSSYRAYAVDFDGNGSRDLWGSIEDAVASVANYLHEHRWDHHAPVATVAEVRANARDLDDVPLKPQYPLSQLREWGYQAGAAHSEDRLATVIELEGEQGPQHWIGFENFYVITRYNRSPLYAMAVHQLAEALRDRASQDAAAP